MKRISKILMSALPFFTVGAMGAADKAEPFTVSGTIGDYMVLQRNVKNNIWGWSDKKGEKITVSFKGNTAECRVDSDGRWCAVLPEMEADKNENELTVSLGGYKKIFSGVLVGDVYLIGGQSNAEKTLGACANVYSDELKEKMIASANGNVRLFRQGLADAVCEANREKMNAPQENTLPGKIWKKETLESINDFSAIGFFFAHKVFDAIDVPLGMIMVASGGSPVSQLMSKEASEKCGYYRFEHNIPVSGIYNTLMNPFIKTSVKGMLYYQGESENWLAITDYGKYNEYVNAYVEDLREKMNQDFPFYFVQLSSHVADQWLGTGMQRAVQLDGLKMIKNSGMVVSMDQGFRPTDSDFAHPHYKKPVGDRLADLALARLYGIGDERYVTSPIAIGARLEGDEIVIAFDNVGDGLSRIGQHDKLSGFRVNINGTYEAADATVSGKDEVRVSVSGHSEVVTDVSYGTELLAFVDYPEGDGDLKYVANLGNSNGLPAAAFRINIK